MVRIIINGSRDFNNYDYLRDYVKEYIMSNHYNPTEIEIISGGAKGPDSFAIRFASEYQLKCTVMHPDWNKYGKRAGMIRNSDMLKYATDNYAGDVLLLSFWNGHSKGTKHMIDISYAKHIKVHVISTGNLINESV